MGFIVEQARQKLKGVVDLNPSIDASRLREQYASNATSNWRTYAIDASPTSAPSIFKRHLARAEVYGHFLSTDRR